MPVKDYKDMKKKLDDYVKKPTSNKKDDLKNKMYGEQTNRNYKDGDRN